MNEVGEYDIAVVGGGLHGVSIAAEAASRGLSVVLLQGNDLASGPTGSMRSILRGGLRKLEQLQIATVNQNLYEIALLKTKVPHLLRFHKFRIHANPQLRSNTRIQRGLKIYQWLQTRQLKKAGIDEHIDQHTARQLYYYDYQLSNARLILTLALQAKKFGASIRPRQRVVTCQRHANYWMLEIENTLARECYSLKANILINCCGWLASSFLKDVVRVPTRCCAQISHYAQLVVRKPSPFAEGQVFQMPDGKLLYAHNLDEQHFILGPLFAKENTEHAKNTAIEQAMQIWNSSTGTVISLADIVYSNWTSRAKPEDPLSNNGGIYRECLLDLNNPGKAAPLLNVFGMQTVRHRLIAEQAIEILQAFTETGKNPLYETLILPGGDLPEGMNAFIHNWKQQLPGTQHALVERLINAYGSLSAGLLEDLLNGEQGQDFGHGLYESELRYLLENEWASCAEDILWRRSNLGLFFDESQTRVLESWIRQQQ